MFRPYVRQILAIAGVVVLALMSGSTVWADHPELLRSEPEAGASVERAPAEVTLTFNALLVAEESSLTVVNAEGAPVSDGASQLVPTNHKAIRVALDPNATPGEYTVTWKIVSAESGAEMTGAFAFTIAPPADGVDPVPASSDPVAVPVSRAAQTPDGV